MQSGPAATAVYITIESGSVAPAAAGTESGSDTRRAIRMPVASASASGLDSKLISMRSCAIFIQRAGRDQVQVVRCAWRQARLPGAHRGDVRLRDRSAAD